MIRDPDWLLAPRLFNEGECAAIIAMGQKVRGAPGDMTWTGNDAFPEVRSSTLRWIHRGGLPEFQWVFAIVDAACGQADDHFHMPSEPVDAFQFTEYHAGRRGHYDFHRDDFPEQKLEMDRVLSFVAQLSDPSTYGGGRLELKVRNPPPGNILQARGSAILFPSSTLHGVTPTVCGTRYSLVAWRMGVPRAAAAA